MPVDDDEEEDDEEFTDEYLDYRVRGIAEVPVELASVITSSSSMLCLCNVFVEQEAHHQSSGGEMGNAEINRIRGLQSPVLIQ
jgi:hypothetical protein